jgi:hypothetical protein
MKSPAIFFLPVFAGVLLMAGCGSGGSDGAPPVDGGSPPPATGTSLGSLAMPDGTVTVTAMTPMVAGQSASFHIETTDMVGVVAVDVLVGTSHEDLGVVTVAAKKVGADGWEASAVLPNPIPNSCRVLVRIQDDEGGVQESGIDNFTIPTPSMPVPLAQTLQSPL